MEKGKEAYFDSTLNLKIETYRLNSFSRPFPPHFHDYYVIGAVKSGERQFLCMNNIYHIEKGSIIVLNPNDSHSCHDINNHAFSYFWICIRANVMEELTKKLKGKKFLTHFTAHHFKDNDIEMLITILTDNLKEETDIMRKEQTLLSLLALIFEKGGIEKNDKKEMEDNAIGRACAYIEENYAKRITLETLCRISNLSSSSLLRAFARAKGITPYIYLENIRIKEASKLLADGIKPTEVAIETGFADQSHFTNVFTKYIGFTPKRYYDVFNHNEEIK